MNPAEAYEHFVVRNIFVPWTADLLTRARPAPGERVLDLACGTGVVARTVAPIVGSAGKVTGLDIAPAMLDVARSLSPREGAPIEWIEGSGTEMPVPDDSFDLVLCQQGLQFFPDHAAGLREIQRVLAPGGRAVASVWRDLNEAPFMKAIDEVISAHASPGAFAIPFSLSDPAHVEKLAREAGFTDVTVETATLSPTVPDPDSFAPMMMQASAAVLPQFAKMTRDERQVLVERMQADLATAMRPFVRDGVLVIDGAANILTARR